MADEAEVVLDEMRMHEGRRGLVVERRRKGQGVGDGSGVRS